MKKVKIVTIAPQLTDVYFSEELGVCSITATLREAGYDIEEVAERLEKFYINGGKNEKDFTDRHVKFVRRN